MKMILEETENTGHTLEAKDCTDSVSDLYFGVNSGGHGRDENHTFPRRSTCSKSVINRKIDFNQLLEKATEEDKRAEITHPLYNCSNDENFAPINLSASKSKGKFDNNALDLSSLKKLGHPSFGKRNGAIPSNEPKIEVAHITPLRDGSVSQQLLNKCGSSQIIYRSEMKDNIAKECIYVESNYERVVLVQPPQPTAERLIDNIINKPEWRNPKHYKGNRIDMDNEPHFQDNCQQGHKGQHYAPPVSSYQPVSNTSKTFAVPDVPPRYKTATKEISVNGKYYQILALLGKGGSSKVYLVLAKDNGLLAIKCVNLGNVDEKTKMDHLNEIEHLMKMQHCRHIIKVIDHEYVASRNLLYAVMERGDTDLSRILKERMTSGEGVPPEMIAFYWSEILLAVKSIHDNNIIHRDLKPANFLLVAGRLKLIDFGIASAIQGEQTSVFKDSQSGTPNYMSPEAWEDLGVGNERIVKIGRKTDVWSLGCILYSFLYGKTPFQEYTSHIAKFRAITNPNHNITFPPVRGVPQMLIESCRRCLIYNKSERATIEELIALKNQIHITPTEALTKLHGVLDEVAYSNAAKALVYDGTT